MLVPLGAAGMCLLLAGHLGEPAARREIVIQASSLAIVAWPTRGASAFR
jgi:hypothetical protein